MARNRRVKDLISAGAWISAIFAVQNAFSVLWYFFLFYPFYIFTPWNYLRDVMIYWAISSIIGLIFAWLWFCWRVSPPEHRLGLIATGGIGLVVNNFLPGLLVLIAGIIVLPKSVMTPVVSGQSKVTPLQVTKRKLCNSCGATILDSQAIYCAECGSILKEEQPLQG